MKDLRNFPSAMWRSSAFFLFALAVLPALTAYSYAEIGSGSCTTSAQTRQLDFWLGDWNMMTSGTDPAKPTAKVSLSLDRCLFVQHWDSSNGHVSEKMFAYSPDDNSWYGMFADNQGRVHVFTQGTVAPNKAEFRGPSRGPHGEAILNKLTVARTSPDQIEETWEKSSDNGATWTAVYRAQYKRAHP